MSERKIKLWMPVTKNKDTGEYYAALSDTSLDRDDEMIGKSLILDWAKYKSLKALANHDNSMQSWVGGWNDLKAVEKGEEATLFAQPWFFSEKANPLAAQIKKQVDEALEKGENPGISIGAIVHDSEIRKINGNDVRVFTKGELLEGTWVPIQSNRNATYGHIAKKFGIEDKQMEGSKMDKEFTQKDIDSAVEKKADELKEAQKKEVESKDAEISKLTKDLEKSQALVKEAKEDAGKAEKAAEAAGEKAEKKLEAAVEKAEDAGKKALEKQKFADQGGDPKDQMSTEETEKAFKDGKLPVMYT